MGRSGQEWEWSDIDRSGQEWEWSGIDRSHKVWAGVVRDGHGLIGVDSSGQRWTRVNKRWTEVDGVDRGG